MNESTERRKTLHGCSALSCANIQRKSVMVGVLKELPNKRRKVVMKEGFEGRF